MKYCTQSNGEIYFRLKKRKHDKSDIITEKIYEDIFGFDFRYADFLVNAGWFNCKTYTEYVEYFVDKLKKKEVSHAPFAICDLRNSDEISWITSDLDQKQDISTESEIFEWYYFDDYTYDELENIEADEKIKESKNPCADFLGQICIYSECGYIPDLIVKELMKICEYGCNHMG